MKMGLHTTTTTPQPPPPPTHTNSTSTTIWSKKFFGRKKFWSKPLLIGYGWKRFLFRTTTTARKCWEKQNSKKRKEKKRNNKAGNYPDYARNSWKKIVLTGKKGKFKERMKRIEFWDWRKQEYSARKRK